MDESLLDCSIIVDETAGQPGNENADRFLFEPTHKIAAEIIFDYYRDKLIYERFSAR